MFNIDGRKRVGRLEQGWAMSTPLIYKLVAVALLWLVFFFLWWMPRSLHEPLWHQNVVIRSKQAQKTARKFRSDEAVVTPPPNVRSTLNSDKDPFALVNGVDYFADYDISNVTRPGPLVLPPGKYPVFHYLNESCQWPFKWVSSTPRIAYVPNFLSNAECDALIAVAKPQLVRSQVAQYKDGANNVDDVRTSSQTWLDVTSGIAKPIAEKIYELIDFPPGSSEMLQILRYEVGQKYDAHNDYFDPKLYGPQSSNRAVTVYLYLSDVEEGGHTWFPNADGKPLELQDYKSCKRGFGMKPKKGSVVVFYDMKPNGEYDPASLHGSCPVKKGTKWGGTLWFRIKTS